MSLKNRKLAILGGTRIDCEIVKAARRLGLETIVISYDKPEDSPAKQIADASAEISVADVEAVASYIVQHDIDGVMVGYSDTLLPWYAEICELAGVPCYGTQEQFKLFTNKPLWKRECRRFGVPTAKDFGREILDAPEDEIEFPLFLKPAQGSGSRGTSIVHNLSALRKGYTKASQRDPFGNVLIEQYLEGPEVTVFWLFIDGKHYVSQIGNRHVRNDQVDAIPLPVGYTFPSAILPSYLSDIAPRVRKMFEANQVRNGMMFMQCIVQDGTAFVYDIGFRLTGSLEYHLTKEIADFSAMDMLINFAVTGEMTNDEYIEEKIHKALFSPCFNISVLMKPGTILRFEGIDEVVRDSHVVDVVKAHVEGETLPPEAKGELRQISLRVLGVSPDEESLAGIVLPLQEAIEIKSQEDESLKLPGLALEHFDAVLSQERTV